MDRPILISEDLVPEIISGRKTATRRLNKLDYVNRDPDAFKLEAVKNDPTLGWLAKFTSKASGFTTCVKCPYGGKGDRIWVRENWFVGNGYDGVKPMDLPAPNNVGIRLGFIADGPKPDWAGATRASIHMRRDYSRIDLEITELAVQRLHAMTEEEALREGIDRKVEDGKMVYRHYLKDDKWGPSPLHSFETLWIKINGQESWDLNPWTWIVSFTIINVKR